MTEESQARIDAMCRDLSAYADALNVLYHELKELRDLERGVLRDDRQLMLLRAA